MADPRTVAPEPEESRHSAEPEWESGPRRTDYRWQCSCGHRYANAGAAIGDIAAQHDTHLAAADLIDGLENGARRPDDPPTRRPDDPTTRRPETITMPSRTRTNR